MASEMDARYINAEQVIENAFWRLMKTDGFNAMTATQIIRLAGVNRSTFYAHYADKYELLDTQVSRLIGKLAGAAYRAPISHEGSITFSDDEIRTYLAGVGAILKQDAEKYQTLLPAHAELLRSKINDAAHNVWQSFGISKTLAIPEHYARAAVCGMVASLVVEWLGSESAKAPEQFADIASNLIAPLARAVTGARHTAQRPLESPS